METIGRYRVVRQLGHGGMGQVFLAEDPRLERRVALKLLHRDPAHIGLAAEAKALAALNHPGIVTIYEIGEHEQRDFIAMEYLPGKTLRELVEAGRPRGELLAICARVAIAVDAAHRAGILHRDIKPENVVVTDAGEVKVVDFGVARRLDEHPRPAGARVRATTAQELLATFTATLPTPAGNDTVVTAGTQTVFGTPAYMAPEVLHGEGSTSASDVFSLGVVVYECITGQRPFPAQSLVEMIANVIATEAPRLVGDPHADLIARMLARDPTKRPALAEVAAALAPPAVSHARPPRRWIIALAGVIALAAAGLVVWMLRGDPRESARAPHEPVSIAIAPVVSDSLHYGTEPPNPSHVARTLARLLADVEGAHFTAVELEPGKDGTAVGARYQLLASIHDRGDRLRAHLVVTDLATGRPIDVIELERDRFAPLLTAIAVETAHAIVPDATLAPHDKVRANAFIQVGRQHLDRVKFNDARPYFEQAVDADPTSAEGWYYLALALAWQEAPEDQILDAAHHAVALAPEGRRRRIIHGVELFVSEKFSEARDQLLPLAPGADDDPDRRELLYFLGEACWHDGRFTEANDYFKRAIAGDGFRPATIHAVQFALAHSDCVTARYMIGLSGENPDSLAICERDFEQLAQHGLAPSYRMAAYLLLGRPPPADLEAHGYDHLDHVTYEIARAAAAGDRTRAHDRFVAGWREYAVDTPNAWLFYAIEQLGEVLVTAEMTDDAHTLVDYLRRQSQQRSRRGYHRFSLLVGALANDATIGVRDGLSDRERRLSHALAAELAGDHATAARELAELLEDPSFFWDYPERAALLRNLAALGRTQDIARYCKQWELPPVFRLAHLPLRATCATLTKGSRAPGPAGTPRR